ncbi:MAG TPA: hypothetical protein VJB10_03030 [Candidatus Peribacteraceae bacterium]|nr:hypothetical protein [Candidatus Peribacteraceae bacterium]
MKVKSGHLLIFALVVLSIMWVETHYTDVQPLIKQAIRPEARTQQVQPLMPSPESFYPSRPTSHQPPTRYESDCWWKYAEDTADQTVDLSRFKAVTEADGTPRLLELPVYRVDALAPRAPASVEFIDTNGNRWQLVFGTAALQKEGPLTGEIIRKGGNTYFVQMNEKRTVCNGEWLLVGQK